MSRRRELRRLDVDIAALDGDLRGVGEAEGRSVHVRGALPGERLEAEVVRRHRGHWYARPLQWHVVASERSSPACPGFAVCGGCAAQHVPHAEQLAWKQSGLLSRIDAAGLRPARVRPPVAGPRYHYRRKARLGVRYLPATSEVVVGFREAFTRKIARIDGCAVLVAPFASLLRPLRAMIGELSVRAAIPQIEVAAGEDRAVVIVRHLEPFSAADRTVLRRFESRHAIDVLVQPAGYDSIVTLAGEPPLPLQYRLDRYGVTLEFGPADFVQVNAAVNAQLVEAAIHALAPQVDDHVLDLFCGIGNFTLPVARSGARVTGIEGSSALVARAGHNAQRNGLDGRTEFCAADLYRTDALESLGALATHCNKVLLDPPRSGAGAALALLSRPEIERVVYVSCDPDSFVNDAAALVARGYELSEVGIFDMFPHTAHVETLGVFQRDDVSSRTRRGRSRTVND